MAETLSEKLHLPNWERIAYMVAQGESPPVEADRRATVEAVAQWLRKHDPSTPGGPRSWDLVRELLSPSPGEGRPEAPVEHAVPDCPACGPLCDCEDEPEASDG